MTRIDKYFHARGIPLEKPNYRTYGHLAMLEFLQGKPWNLEALSYVSTLRPSSLRVILHNGETKTDAETWRVTVYLDERGLIERIEQSVEIGVFEPDVNPDVTIPVKNTSAETAGTVGKSEIS